LSILHQPHRTHLEAGKSHYAVAVINANIQIDIVVLKKLAEVVNVVPVIAKSDTLTLEERYQFKQRVGERPMTRLT
jgi:septin family protein